MKIWLLEKEKDWSKFVSNKYAEIVADILPLVILILSKYVRLEHD